MMPGINLLTLPIFIDVQYTILDSYATQVMKQAKLFEFSEFMFQWGKNDYKCNKWSIYCVERQ